MEIAQILERLRKIVAKKPAKITTAEREWLVGLAADNGVQINPLCTNCYHDAAIEIYDMLTREQPQPQEVDGWALKPGTNLLLNGEPVNAGTLTAANARRWLKIGLPERYFAKTPTQCE